MADARTVAFTLNGQPIALTVQPNRTLLSVLREDIGLTGTKDGCSHGDCGSCTVLLDGEPVKSCLIQIAKVHGKSVTTVEGLGTMENPHPIQQAFVDVGAVQCGYCIPGMVLTAKALLDKNPSPTRDEVVQAISGNLCRCTGYAKIVEAILLAADSLRGKQRKEPCAHESAIIGKSVPRQGALEKAVGVARFGPDQHIPGMLHLKVLRSPHHHAEILNIDTSEAEKLEGIVAIFTAKDIPGRNGFGGITKDEPFLADDKVRCVGDAVALVAATTLAAARRALDRIHVAYRVLEAVFDPQEALREGAPQVHAQGNRCFSRHLITGDVDKGFTRADVIVENTYRTEMVEHAYLEPDGGIAYVDEEDRVVVCASTQSPFTDRDEIAAMLGLDSARVHFIQSITGGGFGGKTGNVAFSGLMALAAYKLRRPAKLVATREEVFVATRKRLPFEMHYKTGVTADGKLLASQIRILSAKGPYRLTVNGIMNRASIQAIGPYACPSVKVEATVVFTNGTNCGSMRGFGAPQVAFAMEAHMDEIAARLGIDPWELRMRNALAPGMQMPTGQILPPPVGLRDVLQAIHGPYQEALLWAQQKDGEHIKRGIGLASTFFGIGKTGEGNRSQAIVSLCDDGHVEVLCGAADIGQGSDTVLTQIAAEAVGVPYSMVHIISADTAIAPDAGGTSACRQTYYSGNAVRAAASALKQNILAAAAEMLGQGADALDIDRGYVIIKDSPDKRMPVGEVAGVCATEGIPLEADGSYESAATRIDADGHGEPYAAFVCLAQVAMAEVNTKTGAVQVRRMVCAHDVGKAINPASVEGQIEGGVAMGLGYALMEEYIPGRTRNLNEYHIPRSTDMPEIRTILVELPDPHGPYGAKGVGECSLTPTAPAIINAIANATGVRVRHLPATPARVLGAMQRGHADCRHQSEDDCAGEPGPVPVVSDIPPRK